MSMGGRIPPAEWGVPQLTVGSRSRPFPHYERAEDFAMQPASQRRRLENPFSGAEPVGVNLPYQGLQSPEAFQPVDVTDVACEILTGYSESVYAEHVKRRLLEHSIIAQVKFLSYPDRNFMPEVHDAARRRIMFACTITEQNANLGSLTVHILQGIPQEHRNMPVDDAIEMIAKNYRRLKHSVADKPVTDVPAIPEPPSFAPPDENLQYLLNLAIDNKFLSLKEIDKILDYFRDRRDQLAAAEAGPPRNVTKQPLLSEPVLTDGDSVNEMQKNLQEKIFKLLKGEDPDAESISDAQTRLQDKIFKLLRGESSSDDLLEASTSSRFTQSLLAGMGEENDNDDMISEVLQILASDPVIRNLAGVRTTSSPEMPASSQNSVTAKSSYKVVSPRLPAQSGNRTDASLSRPRRPPFAASLPSHWKGYP